MNRSRLATVNTEQRVLTAISLYIRQHGYSPSLEDLREMTALGSKSVVSYHLRRLSARGLIAWQPGRPRTIRLL